MSDRLRGSIGPAAALLALRLETALGPPPDFPAKVRHRMAWDRRPILRTMSDRVAARDLIDGRVGVDRLPRLHAVVEGPAELDRGAFPREHVLKVSHGSGGSVLVADDVPRGVRLPDPATLRTWPRLRVHPDDADPDRIDALLTRWLAWDFSWRPVKPLVHQWAYAGLPRRIVVEELLRDATGGLPDDLKVFVVDGEPELVVVERVGPDGVRRTPAYTPAWERPWPEPAPIDVPRPPNLAEALDLARRLATGLDLLRVDLYDLGDRVVVGELTVYPMGGGDVAPPGHPAQRMCTAWDPRVDTPARWWPGSGRSCGQPVGVVDDGTDVLPQV